jgi:hypothetical protein
MYRAIFRSPPEGVNTHSSRHAVGMTVPLAGQQAHGHAAAQWVWWTSMWW